MTNTDILLEDLEDVLDDATSMPMTKKSLVDVDKIKALEEMKENLLVALAKGCCRNVSRSEVHDLIDEIYDEYEIDN